MRIIPLSLAAPPGLNTARMDALFVALASLHLHLRFRKAGAARGAFCSEAHLRLCLTGALWPALLTQTIRTCLQLSLQSPDSAANDA